MTTAGGSEEAASASTGIGLPFLDLDLPQQGQKEQIDAEAFNASIEVRTSGWPSMDVVDHERKPIPDDGGLALPDLDLTGTSEDGDNTKIAVPPVSPSGVQTSEERLTPTAADRVERLVSRTLTEDTAPLRVGPRVTHESDRIQSPNLRPNPLVSATINTGEPQSPMLGAILAEPRTMPTYQVPAVTPATGMPGVGKQIVTEADENGLPNPQTAQSSEKKRSATSFARTVHTPRGDVQPTNPLSDALKAVTKRTTHDGSASGVAPVGIPGGQESSTVRSLMSLAVREGFAGNNVERDGGQIRERPVMREGARAAYSATATAEPNATKSLDAVLAGSSITRNVVDTFARTARPEVATAADSAQSSSPAATPVRISIEQLPEALSALLSSRLSGVVASTTAASTGVLAGLLSSAPNGHSEAVTGALADTGGDPRGFVRQLPRTLTVALSPAHLGVIDVEVQETRSGELNVAIVTREGVARELLEQNLARLRSALEESGVALGDLEVQQDQRHRDDTAERSDEWLSASNTDRQRTTDSVRDAHARNLGNGGAGLHILV